MKRVVFIKAARVEFREVGSLVTAGDPALDDSGAAFLIRRASRDPLEMAALRRAMADVCPGIVVAHLSREEVVEGLCRLIAVRRLRVFPDRRPIPLGSFGDIEIEEAPPEPAAPRELHWIAFELVDEDDEPVRGEPFRVRLADGRVVEGRLSTSGRARWDDVAASGQNEIVFPNIDAGFQLTSSDEDASAKPPAGASARSTSAGIPYAPGKRAAGVPVDDEYRYRLPGWTPIRMLMDEEAEEEEALSPEPESAPEEPLLEGDEAWDPVAIFLDVDLDEDRPAVPLSS